MLKISDVDVDSSKYDVMIGCEDSESDKIDENALFLTLQSLPDSDQYQVIGKMLPSDFFLSKFANILANLA